MWSEFWSHQPTNYYATSYIQQHGTPYLSPDQGASWHQIDLQEIASSAEHQKSLACCGQCQIDPRADARPTHLQIDTKSAKTMVREESNWVRYVLATGSIRRQRQQFGVWRRDHTALTAAISYRSMDVNHLIWEHRTKLFVPTGGPSLV